MPNFKKWKETLLSPFKQVSHLLIGYSEGELNKKGELHQVYYNFEVPLDDDNLHKAVPTHSPELLEAIEITNVQVNSTSKGDMAHVEVALNVLREENLHSPVKQISYPIELAFGYSSSLFALTVALTYFFDFSMNYMVYILLIEWLALMWVVYNIASKRKFLWVKVAKEPFTRKQLLAWLQTNNQSFIDIQKINEHKENLRMESEDNPN